jgi:hypothetical protein
MTRRRQQRGSAMIEEKSAYCVAENSRFVTRRSSTLYAPVPIPWKATSSPMAAYMTTRRESGCAKAAKSSGLLPASRPNP